MEIQVSEEAVHIDLGRAEASRLCGAIAIGYEGLSRAEYYIRSGLSKPEVSDFVQSLYDVLEVAGTELHLSLEAGHEELENPRRPRPAP